MSKAEDAKPKPAVVVADPIDDYARDVFVAMGHVEPFSTTLVTTYSDVKRRKDLVFPGRMTVESLAIISYMCSMSEGG